MEAAAGLGIAQNLLERAAVALPEKVSGTGLVIFFKLSLWGSSGDTRHPGKVLMEGHEQLERPVVTYSLA